MDHSKPGLQKQILLKTLTKTCKKNLHRETDISRHHGDQLRTLLKPLDTIVVTLLFREAQVSRITVHMIVLLKAMSVKNLNLKTHNKLLLIRVDSTEIRTNLLFSYWFWTKWKSIRFKTNRKMVNTFWFRLIQQETEVDLFVCTDLCCIKEKKLASRDWHLSASWGAN